MEVSADKCKIIHDPQSNWSRERRTVRILSKNEVPVI